MDNVLKDHSSQPPSRPDSSWVHPVTTKLGNAPELSPPPNSCCQTDLVIQRGTGCHLLASAPPVALIHAERSPRLHATRKRPLKTSHSGIDKWSPWQGWKCRLCDQSDRLQ